MIFTSLSKIGKASGALEKPPKHKLSVSKLQGGFFFAYISKAFDTWRGTVLSGTHERGRPWGTQYSDRAKLRLVAHVTRKYQGTDYEMEDLLSIGTIGSLKRSIRFIRSGDRGWRHMRRNVSRMRFWWPSVLVKNMQRISRYMTDRGR